MRIQIDPGHGGAESRGCQYGDLIEAEYTLQIALDLMGALTAWPVEVTLTRFSDIYVSLRERAAIGVEYKADLVLSIHVNAIVDSLGNPIESVRGMIPFVLQRDPTAMRVGQAIAYAAPYGLRRRGAPPVSTSADDWTSDAHAVIRRHRGRTPLLVECGFATNPVDLAAMQSVQGQIGIVGAMMAGIAAYQRR